MGVTVLAVVVSASLAGLALDLRHAPKTQATWT